MQKNTQLTVYKYTVGVHILPSTLSVEFIFHTSCEGVGPIYIYNGVAGCYKQIVRRPMTYSFERTRGTWNLCSLFIQCFMIIVNRVEPTHDRTASVFIQFYK